MEIDEHLKYTLYALLLQDIVLPRLTPPVCNLIHAREPASRWCLDVRGPLLDIYEPLFTFLTGTPDYFL